MNSHKCRVCGVPTTHPHGLCSDACADRCTRRVVLLDPERATARFWEYLNGGWVKISVPAGSRLVWGRSWSNGEGWSFEGHTWAHLGAAVSDSWCHGGTDCDGRTVTTGTHAAALHELRARIVANDEHDRDELGRWIAAPRWEEAEPAQIEDEYAQAAGY